MAAIVSYLNGNEKQNRKNLKVWRYGGYVPPHKKMALSHAVLCGKPKLTDGRTDDGRLRYDNSSAVKTQA